jgi:acetyl esterase/lipase
VQAERERNRTYTALLDLQDGSIQALEDGSLENVSPTEDGDGELGLAMNDIPYRQLVSWDGRYNDVYLVDMDTGAREMVAERVRGGATVSPEGQYLYWWDGVLQNWFSMEIATRETRNITQNMTVDVYDRRDDRPEPPGSWGSAGWTEGDAAFVIYDEFDIWKVDPTGRTAAVSLTEGAGRRDGIRYRYMGTGEADAPDFIPVDQDVYLTAFNVQTKAEGFYRDRFTGSGEPSELLMDNYAFGNPTWADDARDVGLITRQSFEDFPDLWLTDPDFGTMKKVSNANPQQDEYVWGSAEIVEWNSTDAVPLQGILYKPEGFDPSQEYPMMVYFYELSSDGLHSYKAPTPGTSINYSFYVSRGYLLFVPDITYKTGYPGEGAMDAVVPGILSLIDEGYVDRDAIGVQGHSWGGYQIAYMITQTDIFAAAEAGAPVVNMTSAYGGIRWDSGMSRAFQYEQTQSRIGGSLWEAPARYIENSPLFFVDKINTPLLMLHNDQDGAVPWYQGIEMFSAMRRLQKPVWMLNYNGERHGLSNPANQKDWAIRMQQFFDHYLQGAPPAVWMIEGVPATEKGRKLGLELMTRVISAEGAREGR